MKTNILKSKRGAAIENAVLFMLIIFALSTIIMTLSLIQHYQNKIDETLLKQDIELEQIGEDFLAYLESGETPTTEGFKMFLGERLDAKYDYVVTGCALVIKSLDRGNVLLSVRAKLDSNKAVFAGLDSNFDEEQDLLNKIGNEFLYYCEQLSKAESPISDFNSYISDKEIKNDKYEIVYDSNKRNLRIINNKDGVRTVLLAVSIASTEEGKCFISVWEYPNIKINK